MKEQLITFETAKLAKEKGFNEITKERYCDCPEFNEMQYGSGKYHECEEGYKLQLATVELLNHEYKCTRPCNGEYKAPTQAFLQKWLREVHKIYIGAVPVIYSGDDEASYYYPTINNCTIDTKLRYKSYEEALEQALQDGLKLIQL